MEVEMNNSSDTDHLNQEKTRLRDYQQAAVDALSKALQSGPNIALLIMAIGTGKNLVIAQAIASNTIFRRSIVIVKLREHKKQLSMLLNDLGELSTSFDVITYKTFSDNQGKYSNADVYYLVDLDSKAAINASELIRKSNKESKVLIATSTPSLDLVEYANSNVIYEYSISQAIVDEYYLPVKVIQPSLDLILNTNSLDVDISSSSVHLAQVEAQLSHWLSQVKINHGDKIVVLCRNIMEAGYYFQTLSHLLSGVTGVAINTSLITSDSPDPGQLIRTFQNDKSAHIALSVSVVVN